MEGIEVTKRHAMRVLIAKQTGFSAAQKAYSAFLACSRSLGDVPCSLTSPFSISAAQSAAPAVFVKAKKMEATGTSSSKTAAIPKLWSISTSSESWEGEVAYLV